MCEKCREREEQQAKETGLVKITIEMPGKETTTIECAEFVLHSSNSGGLAEQVHASLSFMLMASSTMKESIDEMLAEKFNHLPETLASLFGVDAAGSGQQQ